jgi:hypothetical protein
LSGAPAAGAGGTYPLTFTAHNGAGPDATQAFTLTVDQAAAITSPGTATFTEGTGGSFTVTATGFPAPALTESGALPAGVAFDPATGTLAGTPAAGAAGTYPLTFTAHNGVGADATQAFTLTVNAATQAPAFTSGNTATFTAGTAGSFTVTASGSPAPAITESGALPAGVSFHDNGNGTAALSGAPAAGAGGTYPLTFTAHNGAGPDATQAFTLTVNAASTGPSLDVQVSADLTTPRGSVRSPAFSTSGNGELLLAFVEANGPAHSAQSVTQVTGGGLHWTRVMRSAAQPGVAEVWQAYATAKLTGATVTATLGEKPFTASITVSAFRNAAAAVTNTAASSGAGNLPSVTIFTKTPGSLVWMNGEDWTRPTLVQPSAGQALAHQYLDYVGGNTYWVQHTQAPAATPGKVVMSDTAPRHDRWEAVAVEIAPGPLTT